MLPRENACVRFNRAEGKKGAALVSRYPNAIRVQLTKLDSAKPMSEYDSDATDKESEQRAARWSRSSGKYIFIKRKYPAQLSHFLTLDGVGLAVAEDEELTVN